MSDVEIGLYWIICLSFNILGYFRIGILIGCLIVLFIERFWFKFVLNLEFGVLNFLGGRVVRFLYLILCGMMDFWSYFFSYFFDGSLMYGFKMVIFVTFGKLVSLFFNIVVAGFCFVLVRYFVIFWYFSSFVLFSFVWMMRNFGVCFL